MIDETNGLLLKVSIDNDPHTDPFCTVCGNGLVEYHVECFACDAKQIGTETDLKRRGWFLARFELCPKHGGDVYERTKALQKFEAEMSAAYPEFALVPA